MPFSHIPKNAQEFHEVFIYIKDDKRRKIVNLMIDVNQRFEDNRLTPNGSFLYHKNIGYVRSVKRRSGFFFHPTYTMRNAIYKDNITKKTLKVILDLSCTRGHKEAIFWEFYSLPDYLWVSALSQAAALELFRKAYNKFYDEKYLDICTKILNSFEIKWDMGGVKDLEWDWYLEYPMWIEDTCPPKVRRVLNCQTDVLLLLWRYYNDRSDQYALTLFQKGERELRNRLEKFIFEDGRSGYSWYQVTHPNSDKKYGSYSDAYQGIHIMRVHQLYLITEDEFYKECRDKMMEVDTKHGYILVPPTTEKFGYRTIEECCPNCDDRKECKKCDITKKDGKIDKLYNY